MHRLGLCTFFLTLFPLFIFGLVPSKSGTGKEYFQSGEFFRTHSDYDQALGNYQNAAKCFATEHLDSSYAVTQNRVAELLLLISRNDEASTILKNNEAFITSHWGRMNELYCTWADLLGDYFMSFSDVEAARTYYEHAYQIRLKLFGDDDVRTAYSMAQMASYFNFKITVDSAYFLAQKAYLICQQHQEQTHLIDEVKVISTYAYSYKIYFGNRIREFRLSRIEARKIYQVALDKVRKNYGSKSINEAALYRSIGNTYTDQILDLIYNPPQWSLRRIKDPIFREAKAYYIKSAEMIKNTTGGSHPDLSTVYLVTSLLYQYAYSTDSINQSLNYINAAIKNILPKGTDPEAMSIQTAINCNNKYDLMTLLHTKSSCLAILYWHNHDVSVLQKAYEVEKIGIILWQVIIRDFGSPYPNRLMLIYNGPLFLNLNQLAWKLYQIEKKPVYYSDFLLFSELCKMSLRGKLLLQAGARNEVTPTLQTASLEDIQSALPDKNTLFVEFHGEHTAIGITKEKVVATELDSLGGDSLLHQLKRSMINNDPAGYSTTAYKLYTKFLRPVISQYSHPFKQYIIVPDGYLNSLPFGSLVTDSVIRSMDFRSLPYLINEAPVLYKLSGTDYIHETKLTQSGNGRLLGVAPTIENKPLLPFASSLLMQIADEYKCDVFKEGQATSTNFIKNAGQYSYIHLATHADTSMRPHLYFSESREHTHSLPLDSIYFLPLKAELSVLAACNTSSGSYEYGEGTLSFARAFLTSGCKSSISTIWSVDDKTTSEVLSEFYSGLNDHLEKDEALRNAQLKYLKRCKSSREASPFYWSGIILTGDHRPVELEKKNRMALWVPSGLLLLFFVFIYCRKK